MLNEQITADETRSPRTLFAHRFTELYEAAGNPTLRRVATAAEARMRAAQGTRPGGASAQRISDWKSGRNVPARFESLLPVVLTLIDLARKKTTDLPRILADPKEWQRLWHAATTWNPEADTESPCPYLGLTAYRPEHRTLFFGRTRATTELTALVENTTGIIAVVGASGAGKSSLLAAGLVPALSDWEVVTLTPGTRPLESLIAAFTIRPESDAPVPAASPEIVSTTESTSVPVALTALAPRRGGPRRLLIVDQFEELFTACAAEREREDFLAVLDSTAARADDPLAVVIAVRADFYAPCLNHLILQNALEHRTYLLGPMRMDELAQAISGPARAVGLELESGLEELVATELCGAGDHHGRRTYDPGALPLLSHVMAATWQQREGRRLTITGYRQAGGVVGSVTETAEYAWTELTSDQQSAAKEILLGLVTVGQDSQDTRRSTHREDLLRRTGDPESATAAIELLSRTRLISLDADSVTLTHEIVLTAWPRLRAWIDEDRVGYLVRQRLETDAAEWAAQERDSSLLYQGTRLDNALAHTNPPVIGPLADEFLTSATTTRRKSQRRTTWIRARLALLGVALLLVGFGAYTETRLAHQQRDDKNFAAVLSEAERVRKTDPSLAAQLYLVAERMRPGDAEVRTLLQRTQAMPLMTTTPGHDTGIWQMAYRTGGILATVDWNQVLFLWDVNDPHHPHRLGNPINGAEKVAFSPDGKLMATAEKGGGIRVWDVGNPSAPSQVAALAPTPAPGQSRPQDVMALAFAGDGRILVTASVTAITLWDVHNLADPARGAPFELYARPQTNLIAPNLRISPDGRTAAVTRNSDESQLPTSVLLLGISDSTTPTILADHLGDPGIYLADLAFSPDGSTLAVGYNTDSAHPTEAGHTAVQLWDITSPRTPRRTGTVLNGQEIKHIEFGPGSRLLAVSDSSGLELWNVTEPAAPTPVTADLSTGPASCRSAVTTSAFPCIRGPYTFVFPPDGRTILAAGADGEVDTWSLPPAILGGHAGTMLGPRLDATGDRMTTQSRDGRITVWDTTDQRKPIPMGSYRLSTDIATVDLSPDGRTLLLTSSSRPTQPPRLLDISDPAHIHPLAEWTALGNWGVFRISPDWHTMATTDDNGTVQLWNATDLMHPVTVGQPISFDGKSALEVTFSSDSATMFVHELPAGVPTSGDFSLTSWNIADPTHPRQQGDPLSIPSDIGTATVRFTPDRRTMVAAQHEKLLIWDIGTPGKFISLGAPVVLSSLPIDTVAFTADSRTMVSVSAGAVQLWDFSDRSHPRTIGSPLTDSGDDITTAAFLPGTHTLVGVGIHGAIRIWDLDEQHAIDRVCAVTGAHWTEDLWHHYLPQLPYNPPCPHS
ncbi:NACHT and WD repeat domain-containing protein [Nocardia sp. NBC_00511]|uniref:NACHT and WD repeat domain-containing protein n=1 Tax=Nocardia sp. NBC_00511 TaxID=2903591 RepID=UPI0030E17CA8